MQALLEELPIRTPPRTKPSAIELSDSKNHDTFINELALKLMANLCSWRPQIQSAPNGTVFGRCPLSLPHCSVNEKAIGLARTELKVDAQLGRTVWQGPPEVELTLSFTQA